MSKATHNMRAYRFVSATGGRVVADNDDDGEDGAGAKIAHLLEVLCAEGVLVVVARWYGGTHLGSDRFKHIAKLTQRILEDNGFKRGGAPPPKKGHSSTSSASTTQQRRRTR